MKLGNVTGPTPEERLPELGLDTPSARNSVADGATHTQFGNIIDMSDMLSWIDCQLKFAWLAGDPVRVEHGHAAFQLSSLYGLSLLNSIAGDRSKIKRIHLLVCVGKVTADFHDVPRALNGSPSPAITVSGEIAAHSRMLCSNPAMPIKCASLVVFWADAE